jgi:hypothetical protein
MITLLVVSYLNSKTLQQMKNFTKSFCMVY